MTAPVQYYVDPAINANSGTGTINDPYGDLQYALNTITRSTTVGDQINIKAGTAEFPTASLTLATYGTIPTRLILRGYTSAANDGGVGAIDFGAGNFNAFAGTYSAISLIDLKIGNAGTGVLPIGNNSVVTGCEIYSFGSTNSFTIGTNGFVHFNYFRDNNRVLAGISTIGNYVECSGSTGLYFNGTIGTCIGNIIKLNGTPTNGIVLYNAANGVHPVVSNNSIYQTVAGTGSGIQLDTRATNQAFVINNLIEGFSGIGGAAIEIASGNTRNTGVVRNNRWFNCTNGYSGLDADIATDNSSLSSSPFIDAANGDYRPIPSLANIGWPNSFKGLSGNTTYFDLGAIQRLATSRPVRPFDQEVIG